MYGMALRNSDLMTWYKLLIVNNLNVMNQYKEILGEILSAQFLVNKRLKRDNMLYNNYSALKITNYNKGKSTE